MMSTIPFVTFATLDRYENYLEQLEYEAQRVADEPKPGDQYYIEPERKSQLVEVEQDLRSKIHQLHEEHHLQTSYAVNLNHLTQEIETIVETEQFNDEIESMMLQYPDDVEIVFTNGKISLAEFEYGLRNDEDNPQSKEELFLGDLFMGKPLSYWQGLNFEQLREYRSQFSGDDFYYALGESLARDFFETELEKKNISYDHESLVVRSGNALQPDPPIIGYNAIVNATDGTIYVMNTSVNGNVVGKYFNMETLVFDENILKVIAEDRLIPFVNKYGKTPTMFIITEEDEDKLSPHQVMIDFNQTQSVIFINNSTNPIIVQETGENKIDQIPDGIWRTNEIGVGETVTIQFNSTGHYEINVKKITDRIPGYFEHHASGELVVFTENMTDYTFEEGLLMGRVFVQDVPRAEIPWESMGAGNPRGLEIGIIHSVKEAIPNVEEYYLAKAKSLIPFEVNVIIE